MTHNRRHETRQQREVVVAVVETALLVGIIIAITITGLHV